MTHDTTASHPAHEGVRAPHLARWGCILCDAVDELRSLATGHHGSPVYVTEATRGAVRRYTGLALTPGERWSDGDIATAIAALTQD
jgi:hypothetical protein